MAIIDNPDGTTTLTDALGNVIAVMRPYVYQCEADRCLSTTGRDLDTDEPPHYHPECLAQERRGH